TVAMLWKLLGALRSLYPTARRSFCALLSLLSLRNMLGGMTLITLLAPLLPLLRSLMTRVILSFRET
ncbi:hypothetical protein E4U44_002608, partial [Claviceps purpurea]